MFGLNSMSRLFFVQYLVPFLLNQSGSVVFYLTLATTGDFTHCIFSSSETSWCPGVRDGSTWSSLKCGQSLKVRFLIMTHSEHVNQFLCVVSKRLCSSPTVLDVADLSVAVPMVNSLSLVFTMFTGKLLGEKLGGKSGSDC